MHPILNSLIYIILSCGLLWLAKVFFDKFCRYCLTEEIKKGNATAMIVFAGYMLGITLILIGAFVGPGAKLFRVDLIMYLIYALIGIGLMIFSGFIAKKVILHKFDNDAEIVRDRNIGTAAVHFGIYVASGLIIAACVTGETLQTYGKWYGIISTFVYYFMGMLFLFVFTKIYDKLTPYSVHDEIEKDNHAAGIALSGNIIAIGLILMKATIGDTSTWQQSLSLYFIDLAAILLLLPGVRFIVNKAIVRKVNLLKEIQNNNVAAGIIEFAAITCFALLIVFMADFTSIM